MVNWKHEKGRVGNDGLFCITLDYIKNKVFKEVSHRPVCSYPGKLVFRVILAGLDVTDPCP